MLVSYLILYKIANDKWDLIDFNTTNDDDLKKLLNWVCKCFQPFYILLWTVSKTNIIYLSRHKFGFTPLNILLRQIKKFQKPPFLVKEFNQAEHVIMCDKMKWNLYNSGKLLLVPYTKDFRRITRFWGNELATVPYAMFCLELHSSNSLLLQRYKNYLASNKNRIYFVSC